VIVFLGDIRDNVASFIIRVLLIGQPLRSVRSSWRIAYSPPLSEQMRFLIESYLPGNMIDQKVAGLIINERRLWQKVFPAKDFPTNRLFASARANSGKLS
jgi:hypothetical protein